MQVAVYVGDFHVHEVHMNNLVRVLCRHERAAMWRLLGLGDVAGAAFDVIWQEPVLQQTYSSQKAVQPLASAMSRLGMVQFCHRHGHALLAVRFGFDIRVSLSGRLC